MSEKLDYRASGVDIDEGNRFVSLIKKEVESTHGSQVLGSIGGFAGFFNIANAKDMKEPVLVAGTDGVGTKLKIAIDSGKLDTVGIDLVAMCVNDLIVTGARPLFFLDYLATGKLESDKMAEIVKGIADGCRQSGSALIGGETAEMPGMYAGEDFDLAGFSVGLLDKANIIDGKNIKSGDVIIGLPSSGIHSNGYSLARKIFFDKLGMKLNDEVDGGKKLLDVVIEPTRIYVKQVLDAIDNGCKIKGMVHITGGGFYENIPRVMPEGLTAKVDKNSIDTPFVFKFMMEKGEIDEREMYRVFNMGIGFIMVCDEADSAELVANLEKSGEKPAIIGKVVKGDEVIIEGVDS